MKKLTLLVFFLQLILYNPALAGCSGYVVKRGDNLFRIALRHNTTVQKLAEINHIQNPSRIYVGQCIVLSTSNTHVPYMPTFLSSKYFEFKVENAKNILDITETIDAVTLFTQLYEERNIVYFRAHNGLAGTEFHKLQVGDWLETNDYKYTVTEILKIEYADREYYDRVNNRWYKFSAMVFGNLPDKKYDIILLTCLRLDKSGDFLIVLGNISNEN